LYYRVEVADKTPDDGDAVEIYIDWNAGKGGQQIALEGFPYFQVVVYRDGSLGGGAMIDISPDTWNWGTWNSPGYQYGYDEDEDPIGFNDMIEVTITETANGYIVDVKIPAPEGSRQKA
jgi:hypothetical protein